MTKKTKYFTVNVVETNFGYVKVKAETEEEALAGALDVVEDGNAIWGDGETVVDRVTGFYEL